MKLQKDIYLLREELNRNRLGMRNLAHTFAELEDALDRLESAAELLDSIGSDEWLTLLHSLEEMKKGE